MKGDVMRPHEKLAAWEKAVDLVVEIYKANESFPKEEKFALTSQIRRAAVSVPANIAEGAGRFSKKEFAHFISNAQGSASELETELIIGYRLGFFSATLYGQLTKNVEHVGRLLTGLSKYVRGNKQNAR
jgi:four helix bundle protein